MALFGWKKRKEQQKADDGACMLMDNGGRLLAKGRLLPAPGYSNLYVKVLEGTLRAITDAGIVQLVPKNTEEPPRMARLVDFRGDVVALQPLRELGSEVRRNFRVDTVFDSFAYPPHKGQIPFRSVDLSCGGIAFRSRCTFEVGERFEVVVPPTSEGPLVVTAELLRRRADPQNGNFFACKFVDLIDDEETLLREAVFAIQLSTARAKKN